MNSETCYNLTVYRADQSRFFLKIPMGYTWNSVILGIATREGISAHRIVVVSGARQRMLTSSPGSDEKAHFEGKEPSVHYHCHYILGG